MAPRTAPTREVPLLEAEVDLHDPHALHGLYAVSSRAPVYPLSVLAVDAGYASIVGEHELEDGSFLRVLRFGRGRENPEGTAPDEELRTVRLGPEFFQAPLKEYSEWPLKWWREVVQNSVDAGCSYMKLGTRDNGDGTITVYAEDNGRGMDRDTLLDKFLVLGATTKVGVAGKTGGFGKAKELILLPWLGWRIHTRDLEAIGAGADYRVRSAPMRNGTRLEVTMSADSGSHTTLNAAKEFLSRCNIPQVDFDLVNESDPSQNTTMNPISDVSTMTMIGDGSRFIAYYREIPNSQRIYAWVRINGLFMFDIYVGQLPGQIVVELQGSSLDILHSNRDSFRERSVQREVSELQERLAKDTASALRAKKGHVKKKWVQGDRFRAPRLSSPTYLPIDVMKPTEEGKYELSTGALDAIVGEYQQEIVRNEEAVERQARTDLARDQLQSLAFGGDRHLEAALKQLSWKPDFILVSEVDNFRVPVRFTPEKMSTRVRRLLSVWAECCRWVLMQLGCASEYSVGFYFTQNASAAFMREENENWLLLNPFASREGLRILERIHYEYESQKNVEKDLLATMFQVTQRSDFQWLYSLAVHECTHFADDVMYHDEAFSSAMTVNFARCADGMKQYRRILDATKGGRLAGDD
jgi:hypothetical protein